MPATLNGIGTHYYGKSNKSSRTGVCESCGNMCRLDSYDTRLWFVVIFVPIIPLGKKRIIDECSRCHRHFASSHAEYEATKRESITEAMQQYEQGPSPEAALDFHGTLLTFHHYDQAKDFRELSMERFRDSDILLQGLAAQIDHAGRAYEAEPFYEKALAMRPDITEIRMGAADARIADCKLDEARELLKPLESPGAGENHSLGRLEMLAKAFQREGRNLETLEICKHLLAEIPDLESDNDFRRLVSTSEKALSHSESMLPEQPFSISSAFSGKKRKPVLVVAVTLIVVAALLLSNEYWRRHRAVYLLNESGSPAKVVIDDQEPINVGEFKRIELSEGKHHIKVSGPVENAFDIEMSSNYFHRWTHDPAWVVSVVGGSPLFVNTVHYAANPRPTQTKLVLVERMYSSPHVDYPFTPPPGSIDAEAGQEKTKIHLELPNLPAHVVFQYAINDNNPAAWAFAEKRLRLNRFDSEMLNFYQFAALMTGQRDRARRFLAEGLNERPISIVWHRVYQDITDDRQRETELVAEYEKRLADEPNSAAMMYLLGRIEPNHAKSLGYFQRSCDTDSTLAWPQMALAYDASSRGDWPKCLALADKARELKLDYSTIDPLRIAARFATGEAAAIEQEARRILAAEFNENSYNAIIELCEALVVQGKPEQAQHEMTMWITNNLNNVGEASGYYQWAVRYMMGKFDSDLPPNTSVDMIPYYRFHVFVIDKPELVANDPALQETLQEPWNALALSVSFALSGKQAEAAAWREKCCDALDEADADSRRAVALLRAEKPPTQKQLDDVVLLAENKSLLAAALALRFPNDNADLVALAHRLNVRRNPPYHLVKKAVGEE